MDRLLRGHYSPVIAPTDSFVNPGPALPYFGLSLVGGVSAGCYQPLLPAGPSRRYLCESFPGCLGPCHGGFAERTCLFLPPRHRPSPVHYRGRLPACTRRNDFMTDPFFETAAISLCSGPQVCLPPRSFLPLRLIAAGQPRLLRPSRTCVVASACIGYANHPPRQLVVWGLAPHKIHSHVGCSSAMGMLRQQSFNMTELRNGATGFRSNLMLLDSFYVIGG